MAGIAGMGTPTALAKPVPGEQAGIDLQNVAQVPDIKSMPMPAPAEPDADLEALFNQTAQAQDQDLEALFQQSVQPEPQAESLLGKAADVAMDVGGIALSGLQTAGEILDYPVKPVRAMSAVLLDSLKKDPAKALSELSDINNPMRMAIAKESSTVADMLSAAGDALLSPSTAPTMADVLKKVPGFDKQVTVRGDAIPGIANEAWMTPEETEFRDKTTKAVPAYALSIPADMALAGGVFKGIGALSKELGTAVELVKLKRAADKNAISVGGKLLDASEQLAKGENEIKDSIQILKNFGLEQSLLPSQRNLMDPKIAAEARQLAANPKIQAVFDDIGNQSIKNIESVADRIGTVTGKRQDIGANFSNILDDLQKYESKQVGLFRDVAKKEMGNGSVPVPMLEKKINDLAKEFGFRKSPNGNDIAPDPYFLLDKGLAQSTQNAEAMIRRVTSLKEKVFNYEGRLSMDNIANIYEDLSKTLQRLYKQKDGVDFNYRSIMTGIKDSIRDDFTNAVNVAVKNTPLEGQYQQQLKTFSNLMNDLKNVTGAIDKDSLTAASLAKNIFTSSNRARAESVKNILASRNPQLWSDIKGAYLAEVFDGVRSTKTAKNPVGFDFGKAENQIKKLGEVGDLLFESAEQKQALEAALRVGKNVVAGTPEFFAEPKNVGMISRFFSGIANFLRNPSSAAKVLEFADEDKRVIEFLQKGGIEASLKAVPKSQKGSVRMMLEKYMENAARNNAIIKGTATATERENDISR